MIHNIPQPALEQEFADRIADDPNITLRKGFSIHAVKQVNSALIIKRRCLSTKTKEQWILLTKGPARLMTRF